MVAEQFRLCFHWLVYMDADQASQVFQRLQLLEQAAEQLNVRRNAEHSLVEAQTRITQLNQALQQGGQLGAAVVQVVDTREARQMGRRESFVMKAYAGAIDQELSTDMTNKESSTSTDVLSNETMAGQTSTPLCVPKPLRPRMDSRLSCMDSRTPWERWC